MQYPRTDETCGDWDVIKISIKNGDIDSALNKFNAAKKEQNKAFDDKVSAYFAPKGKEQPEPQPAKRPAPTYQTILSRSKRVS